MGSIRNIYPGSFKDHTLSTPGWLYVDKSTKQAPRATQSMQQSSKRPEVLYHTTLIKKGGLGIPFWAYTNPLFVGCPILAIRVLQTYNKLGICQIFSKAHVSPLAATM